MTSLVADLDGSAALRAELAAEATADPRYAEPDVPTPRQIDRWRDATHALFPSRGRRRTRQGLTMSHFTKMAASGKPARTNAKNHAAVVDARTELMWTAGELGAFTHADAEARIAELNTQRFLGFDDWRLPTIHELFGLVDHACKQPAIDTGAFPGCKSDWYWSSTTSAWSSGSAWFVGFNLGDVYYGNRYGTAFVRAVRRVSPAGQ